MNTIKRFFVLAVTFIAIISFVGLTGCKREEDSTADKKQSQRTKQMMKEAYSQVGMPAISNYKELKDAKMITELRDQEDLVCHAYLFSEMKGELIYIGKCIGYGLPYSVQMTNPERVAHRETYASGSFGTLPQPEPNGLFMPEGLDATWLMMLDEDGEPHPVYFEPKIVVSPFKLQR